MTIDRRRFYHKRDRLKRFRAFCQVVQSGSITRAAERLDLGQPSVSQQVRSLETELGVRLFTRNGPHIALTAAGESLYRIAMPLVEGMDSLRGAFAEQNDRISGIIRIAAGQASKSFVLPRFLKQFRDHYPDVRFHIVRSATSETLRLLRARTADLAFSSTNETPTGMDPYWVFSYSFVLIVPLGHPLAGRESVDLKEASLYPAVAPASGTYSRMFGELEVRRLGIEINVAVEAHGWEHSSATSRPGSGSPSSPISASPIRIGCRSSLSPDTGRHETIGCSRAVTGRAGRRPSNGSSVSCLPCRCNSGRRLSQD